MIKRSPPRLLSVKRSYALTPHMQRVVLTGEQLLDFPVGQEGANVKLLIPQPGQQAPNLAAFRTQAEDRPIVRTYTVRQYRPEDNELDIDFAIHTDAEGRGGPACAWAINAQPGDMIGVAGPGPRKLNSLQADWFLFAADMTALPAASAILESLADDAVGYAFFEVTSSADAQQLRIPAGIKVKWLVHAHPQKESSQLLEQMQDLQWPAGTPSIFVAGEGNAVRKIRQYVLKERGVARDHVYISPYWKIGLVEDEHQVQKRAEMED